MNTGIQPLNIQLFCALFVLIHTSNSTTLPKHKNNTKACFVWIVFNKCCGRRGLKAIGFHSTSTVSLSLVGHEHEWKFLYDIRGVHVPTSTPPPDSRKWASVLKRFSPFYYCCHLQPYPPRHGRFASGLKDIQMTTTSKAPFPWPLTSSPSRGGHWMGTKLRILRPIKYCKLIIPSKHQTTDPPSHLDI